MKTSRFRTAVLGLLSSSLVCVMGSPSIGAEPTPDAVNFFEKRIRPLLVEHCHACHSKDANKVRGGLLLDSRAGVAQGGDSGSVIVPGKPDESLLIQAVKYTADLRMPPKEQLSPTQINDLVTWVKMGAPDPRTGAPGSTATVPVEEGKQSWSFQPVKNYPLPRVKQESWPLNEVDHFILAKLEEKGLKPMPPADRRTLLRRATYDLTGLPPTPEEIQAFLDDDSPEAFARVVDRLLASSAYGERWGRHWLDVVRYADTAGDNSDYPIPQMYRYRDWVIDAFNKDMPYPQFIREQLAGDLLPSTGEADRRNRIIATGYLANARRFGSYEDARYPWHLTIEDTIDNLGRTYLGLTINCARCHDHKFDPISNEDYYALYGFFMSTRYPWPGIELDKAPRDLIPLAEKDKIEAVQRQRADELRQFDTRIKKLEAEKQSAETDLMNAEKIEDENQRKTKIAESAALVDKLKKAVRAAQKEREKVAREPLPFELAYAVTEGKNEGKKKVGNACIQIKGDPERQGKEVPRRFPTVLGGMTLPSDSKGSGRLELADWIADENNPLTARVMVNRIWHYHFGKGIVQTPSDFGKQGIPPTHPELLDHLARTFISKGWSIKAMHRLIMLSRTYQMSSEHDDANSALDADNDFLWRFRRHRLDAESIRDAMLAVSGGLDRTRGGAHPFPAQTTWDFTQHKPFKAVYDTNHRSVYLMTQRIQRHPFLALFDGADTNASTARRTTSTTSLQALFLMNDPFVHEQASLFAQRLLREKADANARVEYAYLLTFGRAPTTEESSRAMEFLDQVRRKLESQGLAPDAQTAEAWKSLARVLFMSNEFVYVK